MSEIVDSWQVTLEDGRVEDVSVKISDNVIFMYCQHGPYCSALEEEDLVIALNRIAGLCDRLKELQSGEAYKLAGVVAAQINQKNEELGRKNLQLQEALSSVEHNLAMTKDKLEARTRERDDLKQRLGWLKEQIKRVETDDADH
jgi:hypothetical protein